MAAMAKPPININTASVATLQQVNGINSARANAIVKHRRTYGHFASVNDLIKVPGISKTMLNRIRPQVTVGRMHKSKHPHRKADHYYY